MFNIDLFLYQDNNNFSKNSNIYVHCHSNMSVAWHVAHPLVKKRLWDRCSAVVLVSDAGPLCLKLSPNRVIAKAVKSCTYYCCYVRCKSLMVRVCHPCYIQNFNIHSMVSLALDLDHTKEACLWRHKIVGINRNKIPNNWYFN